uniref:Cytoplasmic protein n=1 Tax=Solibacter usitatus (strain Ellin6076) TaxID=234267 RepID=Q01UB3_SOLUE
MITLRDLRRYAVANSLFAPTTLKRAIERMGFVQADPIRAPARAQDLTLRHRVKDYRAGDLERRYARLGIAEDVFLNYGFVTRTVQALMHPRSNSGVPAEGCGPWPPDRTKQAELLLEFVRERGAVHPREVDEHFSHGAVKNYWGGSSNATTHLLDAMHYRGLLRVARREAGIRIYKECRHEPVPEDAEARRARIDKLVDVAVRIHAPLPGPSLAFLLRRLRYAVPQWHGELAEAQRRARQRLAHSRVDGVEWYWPAADDVRREAPDDTVRLLAPFDPVVWDRGRFERLWGWVYRFEAYTPAPKRKRGYYALPLLWREQVIGWGNLSVKDGELQSDFGYVESPPRDRAFKSGLNAELDRIRAFLGLTS